MAGLARLAEHGVVEQYQAGAVIVSQGDMGSIFYLISEGAVSVRVREAGNKEVAKLGPLCMFFGEIAVVTRQPRSATVVAILAVAARGLPARAAHGTPSRDYPQLREVIGAVGLARAEENLRHAAAAQDKGHSESSAGQEEGGLADLLEGEEEADSSPTSPSPRPRLPTTASTSTSRTTSRQLLRAARGAEPRAHCAGQGFLATMTPQAMRAPEAPVGCVLRLSSVT